MDPFTVILVLGLLPIVIAYARSHSSAFAITALTILALCPYVALAADPASLLEGTWRLALGDHTRMLSVNAKTQTALYCDGGRCSEGPYTIDRVVGSTVFLTVDGPKRLHLVIYMQGDDRISVGEEGSGVYPFEKDTGQ